MDIRSGMTKMINMTILNINKFYFNYGGAERFFFELQKLLEEKGHTVIPFSTRSSYNLTTHFCHPERSEGAKRPNEVEGSLNHQGNCAFDYSQYFLSKIKTDKISFSWQGLRTIARFFWSFEAQKKLKKIIQNEKPDLAILHNIYHQISPSILPLLKKYKIPIILMAHDYGILSPNYRMFNKGKIYDKICGSNFLKCIPDRCVDNSFFKSLICGLETWFHHSVLNVYKKNIDYVICPSQFISNMFLHANWLNTKIVHLPYFIYPSVPLRNAERNTSPYKGEDKFVPSFIRRGEPISEAQSAWGGYILYFGRLSEEKGIDTLIEAMRDLPEINLKIVGTGPEKKNYGLRIINYSLKNIEMLDYKSGQELNELIANAKFIIVPSIWYENYPLSILESYNFGVPALVSNLGGLPEMIPEKNKHFIFEPKNITDLKNKISFLWQNDDIIKEAGERVKNFVKKNNDPEKYYEKIITIYKTLK